MANRFITIRFRKFSEEEKEALGYEASIDTVNGNGHIFENHKLIKYNGTFPFGRASG